MFVVVGVVLGVDSEVVPSVESLIEKNWLAFERMGVFGEHYLL